MATTLMRLFGFRKASNPAEEVQNALHASQVSNDLPHQVEKYEFTRWDRGVFQNELIQQSLLPTPLDLTDKEKTAAKANPETLIGKVVDETGDALGEGTYYGTQLALTEAYHLIEKRYAAYMDATNLEPTIPQDIAFAERAAMYEFTSPSTDGYPPHLNVIPKNVASNNIFNMMRLLQTATMIKQIVPKTIVGKVIADVEHAVEETVSYTVFGSPGRPDKGTTIQDIEVYNQRNRIKRDDIFDRPNIGDETDWFSDAKFAQQHFTGTNPTTITLATQKWIQIFQTAAKNQQNAQAAALISRTNAGSFYVQDYSYFRAAIKAKPDAPIESPYGDDPVDSGLRYGCASVCLFHLNDEGKLHPLAIIIDWKGSLDASVTIFNKRLSANDSSGNEKSDWPWRYAKTSVQVSDWTRHEVTVHLVNTHLVEEMIIVATNRTVPRGHMIYKLLQPHWLKTLSLNAAARLTHVPSVIIPLIAFNSDQAMQFTRSAYNDFDWEGSYVPNDLSRRGFPISDLNSRKFHNYAYARGISSTWFKIRSFVSEMLLITYPNKSDTLVSSDKYIQAWYSEIRSPKGGQMPSFPVISTFESLVDAVTMCIHTAAPQHTAVNYLQNYYQAFVINKPPCFYTPLPTSLSALTSYQEKDLVAALPINHTRDWLLASHLPYLLSFKVGTSESIINYAGSLWRLYVLKNKNPGDKETREAAKRFYETLVQAREEFRKYSDEMDTGTIAYDVLDPGATARSILI